MSYCPHVCDFFFQNSSLEFIGSGKNNDFKEFKSPPNSFTHFKFLYSSGLLLTRSDSASRSDHFVSLKKKMLQNSWFYLNFYRHDKNISKSNLLFNHLNFPITISNQPFGQLVKTRHFQHKRTFLDFLIFLPQSFRFK